MSMMRKLAGYVKTSAFWLVLPALAVATMAGMAVAGYTPLVFDSSLYETQAAEAAEFETIDAEALEAANAEPVEVEVDAPTEAASSDLADGTWTGYAACGKGNSDGWKPYYVGVTVRVAGGKSQGISRVFGSSTGKAGSSALSWDAAENQSYLTWAEDGRDGETGVKAQVNRMAASGSLSGIDTVSKATYSSAAIYNAYLDALSQASAAAGHGSLDSAAASVDAKAKRGKKAKTAKAASRKSLGKLADGIWTAYAQCGPDPDQAWMPYYVGVKVKVAQGKVKSVRKIFGSSKGETGDERLSWDASENEEYLDGAIEGVGGQLKKASAAGKVLASVDTVSGATYSSEAIFEAYRSALKKSAAAAGSRLADAKEPSEPQEDPDPDEGDAGEGDAESGDGDEGESYYGFALCETTGSDWDSYYVFVKVKAKDGVVATIGEAYADADGLVEAGVAYSASQNATYLNWAIDGKFGGTGYRMKSVVKQIQAKIDSGVAVSGIQTVSGATRSSDAIIAAYGMAAANAAAGVGKTPEEAVALVRPGSEPESEPASEPDSGIPSESENSTETATASEGDIVSSDLLLL